MARLLWEHEGQVIKDHPFPKGSVTIGRRKENTIVFPNPEVSSTHARIDKVGTDYILTDLQSTNGTFVNNLKVFSHPLSHGDRISIGKNVLLFIGTEKAKLDAERSNIPLNQTVIIGGAKQRKRSSTAGPKIEKPYIETVSKPNYLRNFFVAFLVAGALLLFGVFALKHKAPLLGEILWKTDQGQRTKERTLPPSSQGGQTTQEGETTSPQSHEGQDSVVVNEENLDAGETERSPFNIEAIVRLTFK
jgi:pSer/pThr/pTyr-binding forkhead associated (FHA) protein